MNVSFSQHSSTSSPSEQYSFFLITRKPVLSFRACLTVGVDGDFALKSPWILGHRPSDSSRSTRVSWKVGTRYGSTDSCPILSQVSPCSTQRSMRAPLKPHGSLAARWRSSWPMCSRSFSGMSSLVHRKAQSISLASLRLPAMRSTTSFRMASSIGS